MHDIKDAITPDNENLTVRIEAHQSKRTLCPRRWYMCKDKNLLTLFSESVLIGGGGGGGGVLTESTNLTRLLTERHGRAINLWLSNPSFPANITSAWQCDGSFGLQVSHHQDNAAEMGIQMLLDQYQHDETIKKAEIGIYFFTVRHRYSLWNVWAPEGQRC